MSIYFNEKYLLSFLALGVEQLTKKEKTLFSQSIASTDVGHKNSLPILQLRKLRLRKAKCFA